MCNRRARFTFAYAAVVLAASVPAQAQTYPDKPIRLVIGFTPGTTTDILARIIGQQLAETVGQPVIVENRDGAGGGIAAERVAKSTPDGHTLLLGSSSQLIFSPSLYRKLPYDPLHDYTHVIMIAQTQNVLVIHPSLAATSVKELVALAKAKPASLNYGSTGKGTTSHFSAELFKRITGTDIVEISYKAASQATADLIGGHVSLSFPSLSPTIPHIKASRLRALAVTSRTRSKAMPELPTMAEAGVTGYEVAAMASIAAPAQSPKAIVSRLNRDVNRILEMPEVRTKLAEHGAEPVGGTPEHVTKFIRDDIAKWSQLADKIGLRTE